MSTTIRRLGVRAWVAMSELARTYPEPTVSAHVLRAVRQAGLSVQNYGFVRTMAASGLVTHACVTTGHEIGRGCLLSATEKGMDAQAGPAARTWVRTHSMVWR